MLPPVTAVNCNGSTQEPGEPANLVEYQLIIISISTQTAVTGQKLQQRAPRNTPAVVG
ncbi:GH12289 [Drosophila grimshawi]|uniref:GH12289 n=1 Tax=Drosophila grimshawi TaxID=7222 RepID=B4JJB4_DROGR|nr:GH12289 [Drosophila grimshawi]